MSEDTGRHRPSGRTTTLKQGLIYLVAAAAFAVFSACIPSCNMPIGARDPEPPRHEEPKHWGEPPAPAALPTTPKPPAPAQPAPGIAP
jgi:hypothetical protein